MPVIARATADSDLNLRPCKSKPSFITVTVCSTPSHSRTSRVPTTGFYGLQTLICREMVEAGEVLVRRRLRRASDGLPVPLQLQVLEADFLDATKSGAIGAGRLVQGIEFDPVGKRRAHWLHAEHPGDAYGALLNGLQSRPVPATEIAHVYEKQRTQARGVPWGAPVIRSLRDLDDYEVAELVRKKTEACVTAIVFGDDEAQQGIAPSVVDADGNRVEQFEPGLIAYARGGKDIRFNQPSATGGYGEYKRASLHTISAGFRVPYELLTGDLSQVNYSSIRAGLVEFRRQIDAVQWQLFIPMFCAPVWRWFTEAAWAAGQIEDGRGIALVRISERADVEPIWRDIQAGHIRAVSIGYQVHRFEVSKPEAARELWRAVDWTPFEVSAVAVGADPAAGFRAQHPLHDCVLHRRDGGS